MTDHHPEDVAAAKEVYAKEWPGFRFDPQHVTVKALIEAARIAREREAAKHGAGADLDLPKGWHNHEGYRQVFCAALSGICANPAFFGPIFQQEPEAAVSFAMDVLRSARRATQGEQEAGR